MHWTYANPNKEWEGFRPVAYSLEMKAWELPLTQLSGEGDQKQEEATTDPTAALGIHRTDARFRRLLR